MAAVQSSKFVRATKALKRVANAARVEQEARESLIEQVRADHAEFVERERRRCYLVGSWILHKHPAWFAETDRREGFLRWLAADRQRRKAASLFGPEADSDLLTAEKAVAMAAEEGLDGLAGDLRDILGETGGGQTGDGVIPVPPAAAAKAQPEAAPAPEGDGGKPASSTASTGSSRPAGSDSAAA